MRIRSIAPRATTIESCLPLAFYATLSVALSWPTARDFTGAIVSNGGDARHNLWMMWHVKEALLGHQPLFNAPLLYFPHGISILVHAVGPVAGLLALPFWPLGPEAAYNGAMLVGFWLTGYAMYLLARSLGLERSVALFAGVLLMSSSMVLAGFQGQIEKTVVFPLLLTLLAWHRALDARNSSRWAAVTALALLLTLLHSGWQFVLASLAIGYFWVFRWLADRRDRRSLMQRGALFAASALVFVSPLLIAIAMAASEPTIVVDKSLESFGNRPDLVEFLLPPGSSRLAGLRATQLKSALGIRPTIETSVALAHSGIFLCLLALAGGYSRARPWLLLVALCILFALGPTLKVMGRNQFTAYDLPIVLPYAILSSLPGFGFMRKSGQFMALGFVAFGVAAAFGLAGVTQALPRWRGAIVGLAVLLVLMESWPRDWPQEKLRPVPQFYKQIGREAERYGVFDLPIKPSPAWWDVSYSSHYQMYQMTHGKGIAAGYLSRVYEQHPLFPCLFAPEPIQPDLLVNRATFNCHADAQAILTHHGYRYVVWHKPTEPASMSEAGTWGETEAEQWIDAAFGEARPMLDDELTRVYALGASGRPARQDPSIHLSGHWYSAESGTRWAVSPATLQIVSAREQWATLRIMPATIYDPRAPGGAGTRGVLDIEMEDRVATSLEIASEQVVEIPLHLVAGIQTLTMTLRAGRFRPSWYGGPDRRMLSFSVRWLQLSTESMKKDTHPGIHPRHEEGHPPRDSTV